MIKESQKGTFADYLSVLISRRTFIIKNTIIIAGVALIISVLLPNKYAAVATVLPPNTNQDMMFGLGPSFLYGSASGFSSLAKFSGIVSGVSTPSELYSAIMRSGTIKTKIVNRFDLLREFRKKTMYDAHKLLDEITAIGITPEGIIEIRVLYKNKQLATDIANAYVEELDRFNTESAMTVGKKYRIFIERRLNETKDSLAAAENALRSFQEENRTVALDAEIQAAIEIIAQLKSNIILGEVQRSAWSYAGQTDNPYLVNLNRELAEMQKQLAKIEFGQKGTGKDAFGAGFSVPLSQLPDVALEYARLLRDVKVQEAIYELLTQQYEQARIMEIKDTPTVQFLDRADPPEKKSFPKRSIMVIFAFFLGLLCSVPVVFLLEYIDHVNAAPQHHQTFVKFINALVHDWKKLRLTISGIKRH